MTKEKAILGYPLQVPSDTGFDRFCISLDLASLEINEDIAILDFIFLLLQSAPLRSFMKANSSGTTVMHLRMKAVPKAPVSLPPLSEQRRIVDLVGAIDTCIDALEVQIEAARTARAGVLAELLSTPGDDWQTTTLGEVADWSSGKAIQKNFRNEFGKFPIFGANGEIGRADISLLEEAIVIVGRVGSYGSVRLSNEPVWVSDNALIAKPTAMTSQKYLGLLLEVVDYTRIVSGNAQPVITQGRLTKEKVVLPPLAEQRRIVDLVGAIDTCIDALEVQVEADRTFRAGVLAELLSGEHRLPESYDKFVEAS